VTGEKSGAPSLEVVRAALHRLWIGAPEAGLRQEDERKARELVGLLSEMALALDRLGGGPVTLLDAAAGKAYAGLLAAELLLPARKSPARVRTLERDAARVLASREAASRLTGDVEVECLEADVGDRSAWPEAPELVVALHACGSAADAILAQSVAARARMVLLAPCCTGRSVATLKGAEATAERLGVPRQAGVRRRFVEAMIAAERTRRFEAAGYRTEVVEFVPPTVTPYNLLFRAVRSSDAGLVERASEALVRLRG
jgi:hypothetical protein